MKEVIANHLKKLRKAISLTKEQLANMLNISRSAYANYESGIREMTLKEMEKAADIFGIDLYSLISEDENAVNNVIDCNLKVDGLSPQDIKEVVAFKRIARNYLRLSSIAEKWDKNTLWIAFHHEKYAIFAVEELTNFAKIC